MSDPVFLSGDAVPDYLRGVELMTAGMEWQACTGPVTITMEHIADAIVACNEDPHIQPPRIKLGHYSPLNGEHPDHDPFAAIGDAEPAFGVFANLAATNDGAVLTGDADRILTWLALSAPATYPNRSSEATWQVESADFDVQTAGGKRYSMVVTAVSLLGVYIPAISDLEDLSTLIMAGPDALTAQQQPASLAAGDGAALSISEDEVRQRFNWEWAMDSENGAGMDTYWWWCREIRVTDGEVIADDDEGHLWQVPFTESDGVITFAEPQEVRKTYIPVSASTTQVACFARPSKPQRPPVAAAGTTPAATGRPDPEGGAMDETVREILAGLGLNPDEATEAQVQVATDAAAARAAAAAAAETAAAETETTETEGSAETEEVEATETETGTERVPVAATRQIPEGMRLIDEAELATLRAGAEAGTRLARQQAEQERETTLTAARDEGRFPPARLEHYRRMWDKDPEGTKTLLTAAEDQGGLAKGAVPLAAKSDAPDPTGAGADGMTAADRELLAASRARMGFKASQEA